MRKLTNLLLGATLALGLGGCKIDNPFDSNKDPAPIVTTLDDPTIDTIIDVRPQHISFPGFVRINAYARDPNGNLDTATYTWKDNLGKTLYEGQFAQLNFPQGSHDVTLIVEYQSRKDIETITVNVK